MRTPLFILPVFSLVLVAPGIAHAFRSAGHAQAIEYSPDPYDPSDTHPYRIEGW
jgi:hypothetical protein